MLIKNQEDCHITKMSYIKFTPWVGEYYGKPESIFNKKLMILGASHYCASNACANYPIAEFTQHIVHGFVFGIIRGSWIATYTKFERSLCNRVLSQEERERTWNSVLFSNFYQTAADQNEKFKTFSQQDREEAQQAFWEILAKYMPDIIIVWGQKTYDSLPDGGREGQHLFVEGKSEPYRTWIYPLPNGNEANVMFTYHPSAPNHSWPFWGNLIDQFFTNNEIIRKY